MAHNPGVAGKIGRCKVDGTYFNFNEWGIEPSADYIDDVGFEDQGDFGLGGIVGGTVTFGGRFRPLENPFDPAKTLTILSGIRPTYTLPVELQMASGYKFVVSVLILSVPADDKVRDAANVRFTGRIQGLITYPAAGSGDLGGETG